MKNRTLFFQFFTLQIVLIFFAIFVSAYYSTRTLIDIIYSRIAYEQESMCRSIINLLPEKEFASLHQAQDFCFRASAGTRIRLTLIQYSGSVLADSHSDHFYMDNHFNRPEVQQALRERIGTDMRYSKTMNVEMYYTAIPVPTKNLIVRTSISIKEIRKQVTFIYFRLILMSVFILIFVTVIAYFIAKKISRQINSIKKVAEHYTTGNFSISLEEKGIYELQELSKSINLMGKQLKEKIYTITQQRNELQAMLNSMTEPVFLVDMERNILEANPSAVEMMKGRKDYKKLKLDNIINSGQINNLIESSISSKQHHEEIVCFSEEDEIYYIVHVSYVEKYGEERKGALLVLNNISGIKRLDRMRKELVASVSHELKTPVTSIIGYIETLLSGKGIHKKDINKFLSVINRQALRLGKIIEDLLTLSRVDDESINIRRENIPLTDLLGSSVSACSFIAEQKNMRITVDCSDKLELYAHPVLAEQAVTNLVDNAVKYSYPETEVKVSAYRKNGDIVIKVSDSGPGIPQKSLSRIFDRFYRVDKSRSRELGGTGLGLAIVSQVARRHGGRINVKSEMGKGSEFSIYFPC